MTTTWINLPRENCLYEIELTIQLESIDKIMRGKTIQVLKKHKTQSVTTQFKNVDEVVAMVPGN